MNIEDHIDKLDLTIVNNLIDSVGELIKLGVKEPASAEEYARLSLEERLICNLRWTINGNEEEMYSRYGKSLTKVTYGLYDIRGRVEVKEIDDIYNIKWVLGISSEAVHELYKLKARRQTSKIEVGNIYRIFDKIYDLKGDKYILRPDRDIIEKLADLSDFYDKRRGQDLSDSCDSYDKFVRRKPIRTDTFESVYKTWKAGKITAVRAMEMLDLSKATFYRKVKRYEDA